MTKRARSKKRARQRAILQNVRYAAAVRGDPSPPHRASSGGDDRPALLESLIETAVDDWSHGVVGEGLESIGVDLADLRETSRLLRLKAPIVHAAECTIIGTDLTDVLDGTSSEALLNVEVIVVVEGFLDRVTAGAAETARHVRIVHTNADGGHATVVLNTDLLLDLELVATVDETEETVELEIDSVLSQDLA